MRSKIFVLLGICLAVVAQAAPPAPTPVPTNSVDSLRNFFGNVHTFSATFKQVVLDDASAPIQESSGTLWIDRPDKFRWTYESPSKQEIVGDGQKIWIYDKDLEQVTVRSLQGGLGATPAVLLAGRGRLEDSFTVKALAPQGNMDWAQLTPRKKDGGFEMIRVGFDQGKLRVLEMVDGFGNTTRVTLQSAKENIKIDPTKFQFTPPKGVDVVGD